MIKIIFSSLFLATLFFRVSSQSIITGPVVINDLSSQSITTQIQQAILDAGISPGYSSEKILHVADSIATAKNEVMLHVADSIATAKNDVMLQSVMAGITARFYSLFHVNDTSLLILTPNNGVQYAQLVEFSAEAELKPTVKTGLVIPSLTTYNSAAVVVYVLGAGGSPISASGIVYGTTPEPTLLKTTVFAFVGSYTGFITGLSSNTVYYARAYATNEAGTVYGENVTFTTLSVPCYNVDLSTNPANLSNLGGCYTVTDGIGNYSSTAYVDIEISDGSINDYAIHFNSLDLKTGDQLRFFTWDGLGAGTASKTITGNVIPANFNFEKFMRVIFSTNGDATVGAGFSFTITPNL